MTALHKSYPGILNDFPQGTTIPISFTFKDGNAAVIDITNYVVEVIFSINANGSPTLKTITIPITNGPLGLAAGEITDEETAAFAAGLLYYTARYTTPAGKKYIIDIGQISVIESSIA